jgi:hypothetical protein
VTRRAGSRRDDSRRVLRDEQTPGDRRTLTVELLADGRLVVDGWDLGSGVSGVFGEDVREYEWVWTVPAAAVKDAMVALGAEPGEHPLDVLERSFLTTGRDPGSTISDAGVPLEFWSRLGD